MIISEHQTQAINMVRIIGETLEKQSRYILELKKIEQVHD